SRELARDDVDACAVLAKARTAAVVIKNFFTVISCYSADWPMSVTYLLPTHPVKSLPFALKRGTLTRVHSLADLPTQRASLVTNLALTAYCIPGPVRRLRKPSDM